MASYNGRWFDGGYAKPGYEKTKNGMRFRDYYTESKNNLLNQSSGIATIKFMHGDYIDCEYKNALIYCDPPYNGTKQYANATNFDYELFWNTMRLWSKNNIVLISEENAPDDFVCIWEKSVNRSINVNDKKYSTEKLFTIQN